MEPAILVHGGAGRILRTDRAEESARGCLEAARAGYALLTTGGSALDAVQAAVVVLEDNPRFNAGTGSVLNADGHLELDAMIMDGRTLDVGGVAALSSFKNPIEIARAVLERSPHALYCGAGADRFAREAGYAPEPEAAMVTQAALERFRRERAEGWPRRPGTVGAVAIDREGHVAAATSTGGISGKLAGRVGDTPLPGCGTYADDRLGAASATGDGEAILRVAMSMRALHALAPPLDAAPSEAARTAVDALERVGGEGGIILVDRLGRLGLAFNTPRMGHAWIDAKGEGAGFDPSGSFMTHGSTE